jgi:hypothetical protein
MTKTDEEIVREALADYQQMTDNLMGSHAHPSEIEPYAEHATKAVSAFARLMSRCAPELPEGWFIQEIGFHSDKQWSVQIYHVAKNVDTTDNWQSGEGHTIRAACEAAISKILAPD